MNDSGGEKAFSRGLGYFFVVVAALSLGASATAAPAGFRRFIDQLLSTDQGPDDYLSIAYNDEAKEHLVA